MTTLAEIAWQFATVLVLLAFIARLCRPHKRVRYYDPVVNAGCCYCLSKTWRECRFPERFRRVDNEAVERG